MDNRKSLKSIIGAAVRIRQATGKDIAEGKAKYGDIIFARPRSHEVVAVVSPADLFDKNGNRFY